MATSEKKESISPPRILPSLVEGFNAIASRIYLILFPVAIDLLLWFGPLVRVKNLLLPVLYRATDLSADVYGQEAQEMIQSSKELWASLLESFNLLSALRTYPIGVPSLISRQGAQANPLGSPLVIEMPSIQNALFLLLAASIIGIILGSCYYAFIARSTDKHTQTLSFSHFLRFSGQSLLLSVLLFLLLFMLGLPATCFISSITMILPSLGSLPFMIFGLIVIWLMLPLVFTPHGIFLREMKIHQSLLASVKLVRSRIAESAMFCILVIMISYGLDMLWLTPPLNSWMMLIGILGHGFISSALLASSFVFFRDGFEWLSESMMHKETQTRPVNFQ